MAYTKQTWNNDDSATPLNAPRLNHVEQGIYDAHYSPTIQAVNITTPTIMARAIASQTSDLQQWQNSSGGSLASMSSAGDYRLDRVIDNASPTDVIPFQIVSSVTQALDPNHVISYGLKAHLQYGGFGTPVAALGSAHAATIGALVVKNANNLCEHAAIMGYLTYADTVTATPGRAWFTDWNLHGPIGVQPHLLNGITMFTNNYYNGSPIAGPSAAIWAVAQQASGGGQTAAHATASTYPMDIGIGVAGTSTSGRGFTTGIRVGGNQASGWNTSSRFADAISVSDWDTHGFYSTGHHASASATASAFQAQSNAGGGDRAYASNLQGETDARFAMDHFGAQYWGAGVSGFDVSLNRSAAGRLLLTGALQFNGNVGFYNKTPITQPARPVTLADVINALVALGLTA